MDLVVPVVCSVVAIATSIVLLDGRTQPDERVNDFVGEGLSVWPGIKASGGQNGWFVRYLRCTRDTFFEIAKRIDTSWTLLHPPLHPSSFFDVIDRTALAMYYLTHCDGLDCAALIFGIGKTKAYEHVMEILNLLRNIHLTTTVTLPSSPASWAAISKGFESVARFPNVFGAMDGCLVMVKRFREHEGWYCRKGFPAFNMLALVDDRKRFMAYSLRAGSQNDRMLFRSSVFGASRIVPIGGFIVADAGYTLLPHVLTPYQIVPNMDKKEVYYNLLPSRTRIVVEQCFGMWKNKFRLFKKPLEFKSPQKMVLVIEATLVLHNWIIDLDPSEREPDQHDWMHLGGDIVFSNEEYTIDSNLAKATRDNVCQYLNEFVRQYID